MIRFDVSLHRAKSLVVETETELQAAYFVTACILHANGGGYHPNINFVYDGQNKVVGYRVSEKHSDGGMNLALAWIRLANYMFPGHHEITDGFKREVNERWANRRPEDKGQYDAPRYFKVDN